MIIPKNSVFWYYNLNLHRMINMHSKYDNMHKNRIFYALICVNNLIITCIDCMLLLIMSPRKDEASIEFVH